MDRSDVVVISWDRERMERLKKAVERAEQDTFVFDGHQFLIAYARYLIEYLEGVLPR